MQPNECIQIGFSIIEFAGSTCMCTTGEAKQVCASVQQYNSTKIAYIFKYVFS